MLSTQGVNPYQHQHIQLNQLHAPVNQGAAKRTGVLGREIIMQNKIPSRHRIAGKTDLTRMLSLQRVAIEKPPSCRRIAGKTDLTRMLSLQQVVAENPPSYRRVAERLQIEGKRSPTPVFMLRFGLIDHEKSQEGN